MIMEFTPIEKLKDIALDISEYRGGSEYTSVYLKDASTLYFKETFEEIDLKLEQILINQ